MTNSTPKKVASARAKPKSSSRMSKKNQRVTKNSSCQASVTSSHLNCSQSLRHISVSNEDKELECVSSILEVDSDHIMDCSDDEVMIGTTDNPIEMIIDEEDEDVELRKAYLPREMIHTELEIRTAVKGLGSSYLCVLQAQAFN